MHRSSNAFLPQSFHERKNPHIYTPIEKSSIHQSKHYVHVHRKIF